MDLIEGLKQTGDPLDEDQALEQWLTSEVLADMRSMWDAAAGDDEEQKALRRFIPEVVLERLCSTLHAQEVA